MLSGSCQAWLGRTRELSSVIHERRERINELLLVAKLVADPPNG